MTTIAGWESGVEGSAVAAVMRSAGVAGATLSGGERRHLALRSRRAMARASGPEPHEFASDQEVSGDPREWLVDRVTAAAHTIRPTHVAQLNEAGLNSLTYVEILALVARLTAVDTFCFGIGSAPADLPEPIAGPPTEDVATNASLNGGWVPTVGPASPPNALSLIPAEHEAMHDLHGALYLSVGGMADLDADRGLHRTQMELVAARASLLNECFY